MKQIAGILVLLFLTLPAHTAISATSPMDALREPIDHGLRALKEKPLEDEGKTIQRDKIWAIIGTAFDFTQVSRMALAREWNRFNPKQQEEFVETFSRFLGNIYIDKIQGAYQDEEVVFLEEEILDDRRAVVKTKIVRRTLDIPVHYSMMLKDGEWKVYDVNIEGVSMVRNYRTQFQKMLIRQTPQDVINSLKSKLESP